MVAPKLKVSSTKLGARDTSNDPGIGNVSNWQRGARQIRDFFDGFLGGNPGYENGLHQLQQQNPSWARGAEQIGSFLTGTPMRSLPGQRGRLVDPNFNDRDRRASAAARQARVGSRAAGSGQEAPIGPQGGYRSFADYLREAEEMLGGGGVNYDPQRNALRTNATTADGIIGSIYASLQQQFADSAPAIAARYEGSGQQIDQNTDQVVNSINSSNTAIRNEQTRQLQALGIEDAIANVAPQQAADQANAIASAEASGQVAGNANTAYGAAAQTYNDENKGTAGMEGASKRALLQANLLSALADVDARESSDNASLAAGRRNSALSVAQLLMENDPEGATAAAGQAQEMARLAQQQFENEMAVRTFDAKYGQQRQPGLGLQQVLDLISQQSGGSLDNMDPKNLAALVSAYSKFN